MKRLYFRCNGGHYFRSAVACPFDGWTCNGLEHAIRAFDALCTDGTATMETLKEALPLEVIQRIVLIEFGNESSAFEALAPERFLHGGRELRAHEASEDLF